MCSSILRTLIITILASSIMCQSTCPVKNQSYKTQQRCKCGIKTDGQIYIYCARKQLTELPAFTRSSILYEELILSGNQITRIGVNGFKGLRVKRLYLDNNPIQVIDPNALVELANYLEELVINVDRSLDQSNRPGLPGRLFKSLLNLKIIKLTGLEITSNSRLPASIFNRTRKLEVIHLIDCNIRSLEKNSFSGIEYSLRDLNLDNNQIDNTNVIFNELERMKRLNSLVLSRNKIRRIGRFNSNRRYLLSTNNDIGSNLLINGQNMKQFELDLSFNAINHIDDYAFAGRVLSSVTKLNLNNNELNQFQLGFIAQLGMLRELQMDYNKINYVPDNLFINARYLQSLSLKGNFISQIGSEFAFSGLHFNLERLNLAANKLRTIGKRVFMQTTKLKELNLERNELGSHFEILLNKDASQSIDFDPILNTELINTFEGIESELKSINLEHNNLKPKHLWSIVNLLNIESLRAGHNDFSALDLKSVKPFDKLSNLFKFYRNLTYLDMQNTSISQFPYFIGLNRSLSSFNLARNDLCNVNAYNLRRFYSNLKNLNLNANPLECNAYLVPLREWIDEIQQSKFTNKPASDFNYYTHLSHAYEANPSLNWKCATPFEFNNKQLNRMSFKDLESVTSQGRCSLDMDEHMTTTTTTTRFMTTSISSSSVRTSTNDRIETVTPSEPANLLVDKVLPSTSSPNIDIKKSLTVNQDTQKEPTSFLDSIEVKQTLLGSLIGAFLVLSIVCAILCVLKATRTKLKDLSLCSSSSSSSKPDKSQHISSTASSSSPYEMSKLTLQTMCINSSNSSASSGSSSSTNSTTNSSCNQNTNDFFSKMDPLRLTLLNQASVYNPHYLNNCNLHYLASNLPYSPTDSLIGSCTTSPNNMENKNSGMMLLNDNTYDKLHQRFNTLGITNASNLSSASTLHYNQQNQLINKYIQNLNRQLSTQNGLCSNNANIPNQQHLNETTPFLIIQNMNDVNRLVNNNINNLSQESTGLDTYQHTYHEIGEVLLNTANQKSRLNHINSQQHQQPQQHSNDQNGNELFI